MKDQKDDDKFIRIPEILNESSELKAEEKLKLSDCGTWPLIRNTKMIDYLIQCGPVQTNLEKYPDDEQGRHFSIFYYTRKLPSGETFCRRSLYPRLQSKRKSMT